MQIPSILRFAFALLLLIIGGEVFAREPDAVLDVWPDLAPGESTRNPGEALPRRENENPPATRIAAITQPRLMLFQPLEERRNGTAVLIFPGGAYNYVVADKEGSEAAEWLNKQGVTAFVLHYRTREKTPTPQQNPNLPSLSERPLQDAQRGMSLVRERAAEWGLKPDRIGVIGFSAGGNLGALVSTRFDHRAYESLDDTDAVSCRPDFSMLIYPWRLVDEKTNKLHDVFPITESVPPALLIHAHNDGATPISSVMYYVGLKQHGIPAELHIYETGGHGYGMRPVPNSNVATWIHRAEDWLTQRSLATPPAKP